MKKARQPKSRVLRLLSALVCILLVLLVLGLLFMLWRGRIVESRGLQIDKTAAVVEQVRRMGELSSAGFYEELVLTDKDDSYLGELRRVDGIRRIAGSGDFVIICKGRVRAGFDLTKMKQSDFYASGDTLRVTLPPVAVLDVIINPTDYEHFSGHRTHEETVGIILQAKQRLRADAVQAGVLDQAEASGVASLQRLFSSLGYKEVEIILSKEYPLRRPTGESFLHIRNFVYLCSPKRGFSSAGSERLLDRQEVSSSNLLSLTLQKEALTQYRKCLFFFPS